jgi:class 3 adenylate cyclase
MWAPQPSWVFEELEAFVRVDASRSTSPAERVFAVVLFTDLVGSTQQLAKAGDRRWAELLDVHDNVTAREVERAGGRVIERTGDGVLATFDGPARAVRCAQAMRDLLRQADIDIRSGLHAGEVELRGSEIGGIAVHIAARISAEASGGEILCSSTVRDLVTGSDLEFVDRGRRQLKGVPQEWQLYEVR